MKVLVATHQASLDHDTGPAHPERPARVEAVLRGIRGSGLVVSELESPPASNSDLTRVHHRSYVEQIEVFCRLGGGALDYDTVVSPASWDAAIRAAGGLLALVEELEASRGTSGFAVTRPPGHHALADRAMGFCLFNNVAVAASALRTKGQRVAIVDWDVHHGNGTQTMLGDDPGVLYVSMHQDALYPFEGFPADIDRMEPGTNINIPVPAGTAGDLVRPAWRELVVPVLTQFEPDWVLVSAGFDAHHNDPIADLALIEADYGHMAAGIAEVIPPERIIIALEGGYDLAALEHSTASTLRGLSGELPSGEPFISPPGSQLAIDRASMAISRYWSI